MIDERGYYSTKDMVKRYRRSARTIYRWVEKGILPPPDIRQTGGESLWAIASVINHDNARSA